MLHWTLMTIFVPLCNISRYMFPLSICLLPSSVHLSFLPSSLPVCNPCLRLNMHALTHTLAHALPYLCSQTRLPVWAAIIATLKGPGFMANEKRHAVPNHTPLTLPCGGCMSYFTLRKVMCVEGFHSKILDWVNIAWLFFSFYPF